MWKARDDSNTITISGHRFGSLRDAVRDARLHLGRARADVDDD